MVKQAVLSSSTLVWPNVSDPFILYTDASEVGIGAMLVQNQTSGEVPVGFFSQKFTETATRWSTIEKECFALFAAVLFFQSYLLGRLFFIKTDHKNLVYMANSIVPKVIRWRLRLLEYKFIVLHVPGVENVVADALSRSFSHRGVELESITADEKRLRLLSVHNEIVGHHGIAKTIDILKAAKLGWKGMYEDVKTFIHNCMVCQKFKTSKHLCKGTLDYHIHGSYPMQSLSVDTLGPLSEDVFGHKYILVIVDNFSKFATLYPTRSTEAKEFVQALIHHIGLFGVPKQIRTDGGTRFTPKSVRIYHPFYNMNIW